MTTMTNVRRNAERRSVISSCFAENFFCCIGTKCAPYQELSGLISR